MKRIFFLVSITLAIYQCKSGDSGPAQRFDFYVRIDEAQNAIKATATVHETGKTPQAVEIPGGIFYQGKEMDPINIPEPSYVRQTNGGFSSIQVFHWKGHDNQPREFKASMNQVKDFNFGSDTIHHDRAAVLRWNGPILDKGEALVLIWENNRTHQTVPIEFFTVSGEPRADIPVAKLAPLTPGEWSVYLVRKRLLEGKLQNAAISCVMEQYTQTKKVWVL